MTDEPKNPLPPKAELDAVDDIGAIDVPDAPDGTDGQADAAPVTPHVDAEVVSDNDDETTASLGSGVAHEIHPGSAEEFTETVVNAPDSPVEVDATPSHPEEQRPRRDIYDVTGRARPQWIVPKTPAVAPRPAPDEGHMTSLIPGDSLDPHEAGGAIGEESPEVLAGSDALSGIDTPDAESATHVFRSQPKPEDTSLAVPTAPAESGFLHTEETTFFAASPTNATSNGNAADDAPIDRDDAREAGPNVVPEAEGGVATAVHAPRGTLDLGLLLLRILVGVPLIVRGLQTLFGFGGDPGIDALEVRFGDFTAGDILAIALPTAEVVGGGLLLLGLATPIGGAVAFIAAGFMALFELSLSDVGYWPYQMSQSAQSWAFLGLISLILIVTGPGRYSADLSRPWATRPRVSAWLWTTISIAGMVILWLFVAGGSPF